MKFLRIISVVLCLAAICGGVAWSQTVNATLLGTVTDSRDGISNPVVGYSASLPWVRAEANVDVVKLILGSAWISGLTG